MIVAICGDDSHNNIKHVHPNQFASQVSRLEVVLSFSSSCHVISGALWQEVSTCAKRVGSFESITYFKSRK